MTRWLLGGLLILAMLTGLVVAVRWRIGKSWHDIYPWARRHRFVSWSGAEIALTLLVYMGSQSLALNLLALFDSAQRTQGSQVGLAAPESIHGDALFRRLAALGIAQFLAGNSILALLCRFR